MGTGRKFYIMGIRGRLVLSLLLLVVLSMWLLGLALMDLMRSAAREQFRARGRTISAAVEHAVGPPSGAVPEGGQVPDRLAPLLAALTEDPDVALVAVFDGGGRRVAAVPPAALSPEPGDPESESLRFSFPLALGPDETGRVEVRFARSGLQRHLALSLLRVIIQLAITALVLIIFINVLTTLTVLVPLRRLLDATERIGGGDLDHPVEAGGRNELGDLARSFNHMLERLRSSEERNRLQLESLRQAHLDLQSKERQLVQSEKMAAVGRVASGVAHEVGNPLGSVTGYLAMLREEELTDEERADYLSRTEKELGRINRIMLDLLNYARPPRLEWDLVDVNALLRNVRDLLAQQPELAAHSLRLDLQGDVPSVRADGHHLQQILVNIVLNASQAMPGGGDITLGSSIGSDGEVCLAVSDRGPGIAGKDLPHIFEPFFTSRRGSGGSGLGLALCQQIAESMGARLEVDSRAGEGATFKVVFPPGRRPEKEGGRLG